MFWAREVNTATVASMASLQRSTGTANWCRGAAKPCRPLSQCTLLLRAAFSTGATAGAAAQEEEKGEIAKEAGEECMRISGRSWTIKPGLVTLWMCFTFFKYRDK